MTDDDVARIEAELGVQLPTHYRAFVLAYPQSLREARCGHLQEPASASFLFDDPAAVIAVNRRFRAADELILEGDFGPWPADYLVVGMDLPWREVGDGYCVRLTGRSRAVWLYSSEEGGEFRRFSPSLADFERHVLEQVAGRHAEPGAAADGGAREGFPDV